MSRIGKKPVPVPDGVEVFVSGQKVKAKSSKGELEISLLREVEVRLDAGFISVMPRNDSRKGKAAWGLSRTLVANLVRGVSEGFSKVLEISGVGYRAQVQGRSLQLSMGYSHDVLYPLPDDVKIECPKPTEIVLNGIDVARVGQVAAEIRRVRPPEPYKGKGIRYRGEHIFRKEGKKK